LCPTQRQGPYLLVKSMRRRKREEASAPHLTYPARATRLPGTKISFLPALSTRYLDPTRVNLPAFVLCTVREVISRVAREVCQVEQKWVSCHVKIKRRYPKRRCPSNCRPLSTKRRPDAGFYPKCGENHVLQQYSVLLRIFIGW
jgi:hypothetical protein